MKQIIKQTSAKWSLALLAIFASTFAFAQDSTSTSVTNVSTSTTETTWYMQPWAWVVGGIILLLIIVMLAKGNNRSGSADTVSVKKTVTTEDV